ncbi:fork head domain-containing protein FD5-like [Anneissia japonica]|uniref:fork head domain-containing protein FD5-like n=1 Tax=Anneissia japonica TaxID=1529436 RepID=UPI00142595E6|nr:fork head domain-containing protein FD5-like [Anneissia japonica]
MTTSIKPIMVPQLAPQPIYSHPAFDRCALPPVRTSYPPNQLPLCFAARPYIGMYQTLSGNQFIFPSITNAGTQPMHEMLPFDKYVAARHTFLHQQEPKPNHSYIALIAMAIMNSPDKKLILSGIYQYILDNYPYFRTRGPGWRNSIRHNLSLNDCFVKICRSANGKGHFWAIHPANFHDFSKGDFRRRRAQRQVRKHMGLITEDEDESPCSSPELSKLSVDEQLELNQTRTTVSSSGSSGILPNHDCHPNIVSNKIDTCKNNNSKIRRKRMFDIESLLAPNDVYVQPDEETSSKKVKLSTDELNVNGHVKSTTNYQQLAIKIEDCQNQDNVKVKIELN